MLFAERVCLLSVVLDKVYLCRVPVYRHSTNHLTLKPTIYLYRALGPIKLAWLMTGSSCGGPIGRKCYALTNVLQSQKFWHGRKKFRHSKTRKKPKKPSLVPRIVPTPQWDKTVGVLTEVETSHEAKKTLFRPACLTCWILILIILYSWKYVLKRFSIAIRPPLLYTLKNHDPLSNLTSNPSFFRLLDSAQQSSYLYSHV